MKITQLPPPSIYESPRSELIQFYFEGNFLEVSLTQSQISDTGDEDDWGEL